MLFSSYIAAWSYLGKKYDRPYPKGSPRSTRIKRSSQNYGADVTIRYHYTDVVVYTPDHMVLNTGGWETVTTKRRMNDAISGYIYQKNWIWYVVDRQTGEHIRFFDGIRIDYAGHVLNTPQLTQVSFDVQG